MEFLSKKLQIEHAITAIILIGFLVYFRMFLNGFVGDDLGYITHPYIQQTKIPELFQSGSADLGGNSPITGQFFRPLMLVTITILYSTFSDQAFFYHLFQLLFHIANTILLLFLFRKFFSLSFSFILSLVYLIHPINIETVAYVSDLQDILFVFFGLLASILVLYHPSKRLTPVIVAFLVLLSLLSKETGILFVVIILFYLWLFQKNDFKKYILPFVGTVFFYSIIRIVIAGVGIGNAHNAVLGHVSFAERLLYIPTIFLYYMQTVVFPKDLAIAQTWSIRPNLLSVGIPVILTLIILISLLTFSMYVRKEHKKQSLSFLFFFIWFILGMLLHIQIIPLEMTVADRWFYFPFIGLLGMLGIGMSLVNKRYMTYVFLVSFIVLLLLSLRSFTRLGDWENSITLYSHDSQITRSYLLEHSLGYEYLQQNNLSAAKKHLEKAVSIFPTSQNTNSLGVYYYHIKNTKDAEKWFQKSISLGDNFLAYNNLSRIYLSQKDYTRAESMLHMAIQKFPQSENFWYLLAITEYQQGNEKEALAAAEKAYELSPTEQNTYILQQLRLGLPIKIND